MDEQKFEVQNKILCHKCVGESFLKNKIRKTGKKQQCSYCNNTTKSYSIDQIAEQIEKAFKQHYCITPNEPNDFEYMMIKYCDEPDYNWERHGVPIVDAIMNAANIPEAAANDISQTLSDKHFDIDIARQDINQEHEFSKNYYYLKKRPNSLYWQKMWNGFENIIKFESRFFNNKATEILKLVFDKIDEMKTFNNQPLIINAGPNTSFTDLYRARVFQADDMLEEALKRPDKHIGSPPAEFAKAGRMNAHGISMFYGAKDPEVALAEVRPPVGSRVVIVRFDIVRYLRLFDLRALGSLDMSGSIFDHTYVDYLEKVAFLEYLCKRIATPVMPDDESLEYIVTQAIADFLVNESSLQIDGIIYPSTQSTGNSFNIALFHKAAKVQQIILPKEAEINFYPGYNYEDERVDRYYVSVKTPPIDIQKTNIKSPEILHEEVLEGFNLNSDDERLPALQIDTKKVDLYEINAVKFSYEKRSVNYYNES